MSRHKLSSGAPVELDIHDGLHLVHDTLGHVPRVREFRTARTELQADAKAHGDLLLIPSYQTIHRRYPRWDDALVAVGLPPLGGARTRDRARVTGRTITATITVCINAINEARVAVGDPITARMYKRWRAAEIARDPRRTYDLPSLGSIYRRFPSWNTAVLAAIEASAGDS